MVIQNVKSTDLLVGLNSIVPRRPTHHFLLGDIDRGVDETFPDFKKRVIEACKIVLFEEEDFDTVFVIKSSDRGMHFISFDKELSLPKYVYLLDRLHCDEKFIEWVVKVKYGVLRVSRRSKHNQVPEVIAVLRRKDSKLKNRHLTGYYFSILGFEKDINKIKRVRVIDYDKKR